MNLLTVIFAGIAALGSVLAVFAASKPFLRIIDERRRREERILGSYAEMFSRAYRFVMDDLDGNGKVKPANARVFTQIAGNEMYLHAGNEAEAWLRYRQTHEL